MAPLVVGEEFAGCRVEEVIGAGGMGVVYRGTDLQLERPVAIKLIAADRAGDASARRRFAREARLMAAIDHPNVIPVYGAGEQNGDLYLVMRYVDGTDLQKRIRTEGPLAPAEAAQVIAQVARALDAAHARGLVHRDIKPANVLLSADHVYLTDFGITRLTGEHTRTTETGDWIGTIDFMSPEHLRGQETDARSDVYSLGCVLYACLTGVPPFKRASHAATITAHLQERPPQPSHIRGPHGPIPSSFDQVVGRALAKTPAHRYASAGEFAEAVQEAAAGRPQRWGRAARREPSAPRADSPLALRASSVPPRSSSLAPAPSSPAPRPSGPGRSEAPTRWDADPERSTRVLGAPATATRRQGADMVPTLRLGDAGEEPRTRRPLAVGAAALGLVVAAVLVLVALHSSRPKPLTPFSSAQISVAVDAFASAYSDRDTARLAVLLAPAVTRIAPTGVEHGAGAVLSDYTSQFRTRPLPVGYRVSDMVLSPGWVGRASGSYTLMLAGGGALRGHVIFAIQRIDGRARIGLIATQQDTAAAGPLKSA